MRIAGPTLFLLVVLVAGGTPSEEVVDPFAVIAAFDRLGQMDLWPGYEASRQPIAIFDGDRTLLLRHPAPPEGFEALASHEGVRAFPGRHPAMRWNSNADIGGRRTATLLLTIEPGRHVDYEASILLHEAFHVWSKPRYPTWRPNENDRYSYPMDDGENYRMLLIEEEALARALEAETGDEAAAWAATALATRRARTARPQTEHVAYENALELQEGTAVYVARTALGTARDTERLRESLPPDGIRWRCYEVGEAVAAVLDRLQPTWKSRLEEHRDLTLTELLEGALGARKVSAAVLPPNEASTIRARADAAILALHEQRTASHEDFRSRAHRIVVEVPEGVEPFSVAHFDPINLEILEAGRVLHIQRVVLEHPAGRIEIDNPRFVRRSLEGVLALTTPAGAHPFVDGVIDVEVAGMNRAATVRAEDGMVTVEAEGVTASFSPAEVVNVERGTVIRLRALDSPRSAPAVETQGSPGGDERVHAVRGRRGIRGGVNPGWSTGCATLDPSAARR